MTSTSWKPIDAGACADEIEWQHRHRDAGSASREKLPAAQERKGVVHSSRFSLLSSCSISGSVRGSRFGVRGRVQTKRKEKKENEKRARHGSQRIDQPVLQRVDDELRGLVDAERVHDVGAMHGDGVGAQLELDGDLLVRKAVANQLQDLELARRETTVAFTGSGSGRTTAGSRTCSPAATRLTAAARSRSSAFFNT